MAGGRGSYRAVGNRSPPVGSPPTEWRFSLVITTPPAQVASQEILLEQKA